MAGAKVGTKAKLKDDKGKFNTNGSGEEPDSSILRRPIQTSITGFAQARKIFDTATEELKDLLTSECDLLYECKVCRNMFRSLANFVSHKRVYCKEKFSTTQHGHFGRITSTASEIFKIKQLEEGYQEFLRNQRKPPARTESETPDDRVPLSRDLTAVMENVIKHKDLAHVSAENGIEVALQKISSSKAAVFQNLVSSEDPGDDMRSQITELDQFAAKDKAVLREDGKFEVCAELPPADASDRTSEPASEPVIQISDDDETQLSCTQCNIQFSTRKTLKYHMKHIHVADRLVYPCTDCCDTFTTSWSVLRHLYRAHRKTLTQMRRMREVVQSRAFRMNNVPSSFVKKKNHKKLVEQQKLTEEERMDQENQAWMDNMEGDAELPRCGGCGRSFERRAALSAHTYTCQSRTRALARRAAPVPAAAPSAAPSAAPPAPAARSRRDKDDAEKLTIKQIKPSIMDSEVKVEDSGDEVDSDEDKMEVADEPSDTEDNDKLNDESESEGDPKAPFPDEVERGNMEALRKKISEYVDKTGTQCRICKRKYTSPSHLCRHMSSHLNWRRYGCKLCSYVNYDRNRLVLHAQTTHKMRMTEDGLLGIIKPLTAGEAMELSSTPKLLPVEEWEDSKDNAAESSESSQSSRSSDESETSNPRAETPKPSRRKQSFKTVKSKSKPCSPVKDVEKPDKTAVKRPAQTPLDAIVDQDCKPKRRQSDAATTKDGYSNKAADIMSSSQRPVRKRMRPKKDEDFEYDFSNLTRWEGGSYRESESKNTPTSRVITSKRKSETPSVETSPEKVEKPEKSERQDKSREEKPKKQDRINEPLKRYPGAFALMSHNAVKSARAHMRPSYATSRLYIVRQSIPFPLTRPPFPVVTLPPVPTTPVNPVQPSKEETPAKTWNEAASAMNSRFKGFPASDAQDTKSDSSKNNLVDIEKQIDEENSKKLANAAFKSTNVQALLQFRRRSLESKKNQVINKQKVIVMKRISSSGDAPQPGSLLKFPLNYGVLEKPENPAATVMAQVQAPTTKIATEQENKSSLDNIGTSNSNVDKVEKVPEDCSTNDTMETEEVADESTPFNQFDEKDFIVEKLIPEGEIGDT